MKFSLAFVLLAATASQCGSKPPDGPGHDCAKAQTYNREVRKVARAIAGQYIVKYRTAPPQGALQAYAVGVSEVKAFEGGYAAKIAREALAKVLEDPNVLYVEEDGIVSVGPRITASAAAVPWHKDRIDQRDLPLDGAYEPGATGNGVHLFIQDTGVDLDHPEFEGRIAEGWSAFPGPPQDEHGHGTHVAGIAAGSTYGVARDALVHPVRVLDASGSGSNSGVIRGLDFVIAWKRAHSDENVVINQSLGGSKSLALDQKVCECIAAGVVVVNAAGNEGADADTSSPGRVRQAVAVGATDRTDRVAPWSNTGPLLDIHAPGVDVLSARNGGGAETMSGTSMASPVVAGAAALVLEKFPDAGPEEVRDRLVLKATAGKLGGLADGSPDLLLFVRQE